MCNPFFRIGSPFSWISNSMPRINNSFSRIATRFLDLKINKLQSERNGLLKLREARFKQFHLHFEITNFFFEWKEQFAIQENEFEKTNYKSMRMDFQFERTNCTIRYQNDSFLLFSEFPVSFNGFRRFFFRCSKHSTF